jgi:hypothetical protein
MTNNLQSLGTIRANQTTRQTDIASLEAATQTQDPWQQTIMDRTTAHQPSPALATADSAGRKPDQRQSCPAEQVLGEIHLHVVALSDRDGGRYLYEAVKDRRGRL